MLDASGDAGRLLDFTVERRRAIQAIAGWLDDPSGPRFFLLTGSPGSGKTVLVRSLTRPSMITDASRETASLVERLCGTASAGEAVSHFCSAANSATTDPRAFAKNVSAQLARWWPAFGGALRDQELAGRVQITVQQEVNGSPGAAVTGVRIERLSVGAVPPEEAFLRLVREPLDAALERDPRHFVILVDALDECLAHSGEKKIVDLIAATAGMPSAVRFLLTSRPDAAVTDRFEGAGVRIFQLDGEGLAQAPQDELQEVLPPQRQSAWSGAALVGRFRP